MTDNPVKNSILIVDDEEADLLFLTQVLKSTYNIYTAENGENALKLVNEYMPDLILLDIIMPEMDGYQTIIELKKNQKTKKIPVIFISSLDSDEEEEKGLSLNAADYIVKPFSAMLVKLRVRNQIQIVNQLRTIEYLSMTDQLTNIPNRRSFDERLGLEWRLAKREHKSISLLMMDLDKFKDVNDEYGHQQGDVVLQTIAKLIPMSFRRPGDFAARWGGEEFAVLLPNTPLENAVGIAEKIRASIEDAQIPCHNGSIIKITVSIGVNTQIPSQSSAVDDFILKADTALYAAKEAGRNKVCHC